MKLFIILFTIMCLTNCNANDEVNNNLYHKRKAYFPAKFVDHFPSKLNDKDNEIFTRHHSAGRSNTQFELVSTLNSTYLELVDTLKNSAIYVYNVEDTCLNIVNRLYTQKLKFKNNLYLSKKEKKRFFIPCIIENYPIPNFYENKYVDPELKNRLTSDFKIYVLESKAGKFWNEKHQTKGLQMSDEWKNGYSKGIAVSEEKSIVIFWFIIW